LSFRTAEEIIADQWQGNTLNCKPIEVIENIGKNPNKDVEHISKRSKATNVMFAQLQAMNLNSLHIHPIMKAQLFRTYIRPILTYGTENMMLEQSELLQFKRMKGNCLKKLK